MVFALFWLKGDFCYYRHLLKRICRMEKEKQKKRFSDNIFFRNMVFFLGIAFFSIIFCLMPVRIILAMALFVGLILTINRMSIATEHNNARFKFLNQKYIDAKVQKRRDLVGFKNKRTKNDRIQQKLLVNKKEAPKKSSNIIRLVKQHSEDELEYIQARSRWKKEFCDQEIENRIQMVFLKIRKLDGSEYQEGINEIERLLSIRQENLKNNVSAG